ncbi:glycosyltransferase family 4 protein [Oscillospiraceae bacterium N12]|jgi:glycosyltransferase involved in cell wall biosynthesis|uniref:Glycosyltransferase family 4 protein n=1 Tax=Jilunia laotingensis TaxID=2763675 RepID=A0A926F667_9BACT|nr:glycosyltransferase family 4 protein [Jilunia laotingensis]MBC8594096.1 glycosyltransferase family 4 protein [Jilunia laotingensis]
MKRKIFYVANVDWFFISHRLPLALHALEQDYEVYLLSLDTGRRQELEAKGIHFINIPFKRSGSNPFHELKCIFLLYRYYNRYKPEIIHHITLKASLLGSLAGKMVGNHHIINAISGLGYNFTDGRDGWLQKAIKLFIRLAFKSKNISFILQNPDDVELIKGLDLVPFSRIFLIKGSGVNLDEYSYFKASDEFPLKVLFPARILLDKGVMEFIEAAKILESEFLGKAKFILAGDCDKENLSVLGEEELQKFLVKDYIEWIGFQKNMKLIYQNSSIVILPSYREGLPKSLIEACSVGRPIITTDVPGCRECVEDGVNGYLVPAKDADSLADAIKLLLMDAEKRDEFGRNSRLLAEKEFSIDKVIDLTFNIYNKYLESNWP